MRSEHTVCLHYVQTWGKGRSLENSSKCVHVEFSLHLGKGIFYFFLFFVEYMRGKSPRAGRINEKNEMTERIKSQVAWLSKFKCLAVFLKNVDLFCVFFLSLGFWSLLAIYFLLLSTVFLCLFLFKWVNHFRVNLQTFTFICPVMHRWLFPKAYCQISVFFFFRSFNSYLVELDSS